MYINLSSLVEKQLVKLDKQKGRWPIKKVKSKQKIKLVIKTIEEKNHTLIEMQRANLARHGAYRLTRKKIPVMKYF